MPRVGRRSGRERGSGTVLVAAVMLVLLLLAGLVAIVIGYVAALHTARGAADLVALSGAAERARGGDACVAARNVAAANRVSLVTCRARGDSLDYVVSVTVATTVDFGVPSLPRQVRASAHAGRLGLGQGG